MSFRLYIVMTITKRRLNKTLMKEKVGQLKDILYYIPLVKLERVKMLFNL